MTRMTRVLMTLTAAALALTSQEVSERDRKAMAALEAARQVAGERIWPGFDPGRYAYALSDPEAGAYLIGFSAPPPGASGVEVDILAPPVYFLRDSRELSANTATEVAGRATAVLQIKELAGDASAALALVVHEAFHAFQSDPRRAGPAWRRENSALVAEYPETSARNNALLRVEGRLLFDALRTADPVALRQAAREFAAVRRLRQGELGARFAEFEQGIEMNEGLAEYAGIQAVLLGGGQSARAYPLRPLGGLQSLAAAGRNARLRFYLTGCAQALLLDRLLPDWKRRAQLDGAALQDLLARAGGEGRLLEAVLRERGFTALLKEEAEAGARKRADREEAWAAALARPGRRYVIDFTAAGQMGRKQSYDPMNITVVDERRRIHTRMLRLGDGASYRAEFDRAALEDLGRLQYITVLDPGGDRIAVDGESLDPARPAARRFGQLVVTAPGFRLEASGSLTVGAGEVWIRPGDGRK